MTFDELLTEIKSELDSSDKPTKIKVTLLFACNTTGKTRLSKLFEEEYPEDVLCYNSFMEDFFHWDNEDLILKMAPHSWLAQLIKDEGLDGQIIENFKKLTNSKIEPSFDYENGTISFTNPMEEENPSENIKISRGEESLFIWSIFYTVLQQAITTLKENETERSTHYFDSFKYVVIDDPVSSMDDTRIITIALELIELINQMKGNPKLKVLITTHHALFYNVLHGEKTSAWHKRSHLLSKQDNGDMQLNPQKNDSPFSYHNLIFNELFKTVKENNIQKYHFNLFRALLEKTANFLGHTIWSDLLDEDENKRIFVKLLNHYSHSSLSDIESSRLQKEEINAFKEIFEAFTKKFHWRSEE